MRAGPEPNYARTGGDLVVVVPVWQRTANLARVHASALTATPEAEVLFVVGSDDRDVIGALASLGFDYVTVPWPGGSRGDYARKINAGYRATTRPVLFTGADDLAFVPGWYGAARAMLVACPHGDTTCPCQDGDACHYVAHGRTEAMRCHRTGMVGCTRCPRVGVVGTVDDCNGRTMQGVHSTHSLVARWYADQGGSADQSHAIYHIGYWHEYCDDELVQTAMSRHAYAHAFGSHVEHLHWLVGKADMDSVYKHGTEHSAQSRMLFHSRSRLWRQRGVVRLPPRGVR